jgi:sec-independent protein translocase protein TatA
MPSLAGIGPLGLPELLIILVVIVIIFGVGKLPQIGGALGQGIREFRHSSKDPEEEERERMELAQKAQLEAPPPPAYSTAQQPPQAQYPPQQAYQPQQYAQPQPPPAAAAPSGEQKPPALF